MKGPRSKQPDEGQAEGASGGEISRRSFLKVGLGAATFFGLGLYRCIPSEKAPPFHPSGRPRVEPEPDARVPVVWLEAGVCTGCGVSLLANIDPPAETMLPSIRVEFQETLMDRAGRVAIENLSRISDEHAGAFLLVVDGAVPVGATADMTVLGVDRDGNELPAEGLIRQLAERSFATVALGTCACSGGVCAASPNPGGYVPVGEILPADTPLVKIPGCPPHPAWIHGTLEAALAGGLDSLTLDEQNRPTDFFGTTVHADCPRLQSYVELDFAESPGDPQRCLYRVGCKGMYAPGDCSTRSWNGKSSCVRANHPCMACTSVGFPDSNDSGVPSCSPFYEEPEV
jgi:hydrogenase small subunit